VVLGVMLGAAAAAGASSNDNDRVLRSTLIGSKTPKAREEVQ
jgi:hypothetical protein